MLLGFGNSCILNRIPCHQLPLYCLIERVPQEFVYLPYRIGGDKFPLGLPVPGNCFHGLEVFIEFSYHSGADVIQLHISDDGLDVVTDQRRMSIKGRGSPCVDTIEGYIFVQKIG